MREVVVRLVAVAGVQDSEGGICEVHSGVQFSRGSSPHVTALTTMCTFCGLDISLPRVARGLSEIRDGILILAGFRPGPGAARRGRARGELSS